MDPTQGQEHHETDAIVDNAQDDADFEAGFNQVHAQAGTEATTQTNAAKVDATPDDGNPPGDPDPAAAEAAAKAQAEADAAAAVAKAAEEANAPVTLTKADVDAIRAQLARVPHLEQALQHTAQQNQKAFGRIGSLQSTIDAIKTQASQGRAPTIKQLARLEQEFPELATLLKDDLADAFGRAADDAADPQAGAGAGDQQPGGAQADNPPAIAQVADPLQHEEVQKLLRQKEMAIVDAIHPGWRGGKAADGTYVPGLIESPEFAQWQTTLPATAQHLLANTWDSTILKDAFADFKAWAGQRATQAQANAQANKQRDKRLERAVPATTGGSAGVTAVDDDAAFEMGFKQVRQGRG